VPMVMAAENGKWRAGTCAVGSISVRTHFTIRNFLFFPQLLEGCDLYIQHKNVYFLFFFFVLFLTLKTTPSPGEVITSYFVSAYSYLSSRLGALMDRCVLAR
jgi:hypothetical protein